MFLYDVDYINCDFMFFKSVLVCFKMIFGFFYYFCPKI